MHSTNMVCSQHTPSRIVAVGILVLDLWYPLVPGNVANAGTYKYPVQYKVMKGTTIPMIHAADPALLDHIIAGSRELIQQGARAIVGEMLRYSEQAITAEVERLDAAGLIGPGSRESAA